MKALAAALLLTGVTTSAGLASSEGEVARYAIVVGYNGASDEARGQLSYADDDAARVYLQLYKSAERAWLLTTFDHESSRSLGVLADQAAQPTRQELARVLGEAAWLIRKRRAEGLFTELVFYFAGHGDVSAGGEGFLVFADGPFTRGELDTQIVQASPADVNHVVLDACASYHMVARGGGDAESEGVKLTPALLDVIGRGGRERSAAWERTGVLVSTSNDAAVHESAALGGGVFSYLFRSALVGAGDANRDGRVEYGEAAGFIASASALLEDPRARLQVHASAPLQRPHAPLADLSTSGAEHFLVIDDERDVHLRILDARGVPYAELHRAPGKPTLLALVGQPFYVVQRGELEAVLVPRQAGGYALSSLAWDARAPSRQRGREAFAGLFAHAYGDEFLAGYLARSELLPPSENEPFVVAFAPRGEPAMKMPWWPLAGGTFAAGAAFAAGAGAFAVGNALTFTALQQHFRDSGTLDPALSLQADAWLTAAAASSVGALIALAASGALAFLAIKEEEER